jgi:sterol desaturase/sphingolipid hydroxylase (fatty acid hydroxylase superfamily)
VRNRTGFVQQLRAPEWVRDALAVMLLDYTLYWWHVVEHRVPALYRFHQVHHADLEMDTSTAVRFHAGEFIASIPWRAAQIRIIGVSPRALAIWQRLTALSVVFHHSNLRLPLALERRIASVVMTPRLHGIHHSIVAAEQSSNWSSGLTILDRLHSSYREIEASRTPRLGVPYARRADDVTLARSLAMPFEPLPAWRLPDGTEPSCTG